MGGALNSHPDGAQHSDCDEESSMEGNKVTRPIVVSTKLAVSHQVHEADGKRNNKLRTEGGGAGSGVMGQSFWQKPA